MADWMVSEHFSFYELTTTEMRRYVENNRILGVHFIEQLSALCARLLEPLRDHFQRPVIIHSAYRCPALNSAIGGAPASQHTKGEAADLHVSGVCLDDVFAWYRVSGLAFGQVILEMGTWVHVSLGSPWRPAEKCGQVMKYDGHTYTLLETIR
jgi:hypothetical protein